MLALYPDRLSPGRCGTERWDFCRGQGKAMSERAIARPIPCTAVQHPGMSRKRRSHSGLTQGVKTSGAHAISAYRAYPAPSIGAAPMTNHRGLSSGLALPPWALDDQHPAAPLRQRRNQRADHLQLAGPPPNRRRPQLLAADIQKAG